MSLNAETISTIWPRVLRAVGGMLAGDLSKAILPAIFGPNQLVIQFSSGYNQQYSNCADPHRLNRIQEAVRQLTGEPWTVRIELQTGPNQEQRPKERSNPPEQSPSNDPLLAAVQSSLDARILKVDDGFGRPIATTEDAESETPTFVPEDE